MDNYRDFYLRTMADHSQGLKLTLGGTGLGKTDGLVQAIVASKQSAQGKHRFIYTTYRHQLVAQAERDLRDENVPVVYLKADDDMVLELIQATRLIPLWKELGSLGFFQLDPHHKDAKPREQWLQDTIAAITRRTEALDRNHLDTGMREMLKADRSNRCKDILNLCKKQFKALAKNHKTAHKKFLENPLIWELFPFIGFEHNPECPVLVVTIQKLLSGSFDGKQSVKLGAIRKKVIFLDEFDFLEEEFLKVISAEPNLNNPIEFVRFFFEDMDYWAAQSFWDSHAALAELKSRLHKIRETMVQQLKDHDIHFPGIRHFRITPKDSLGKKAFRLFQTNKSLHSKPIYLEERDRSWYVRSREGTDTIKPRDLFRVFSRAKDKIIGEFQRIYDRPSEIEEIVRFVWNSKNDGRPGVYAKYIQEHLAYHRGISKRKTYLGPTQGKFQTGYDTGYRLFKLEEGTIGLDKEHVQLEQLELLTSPEALVAKLAENNLVFALSATADIPRVVHAFHLGWLEHNAVPYIPFDVEDQQFVARKKAEKAQTRNTRVRLQRLDQLSPEPLVSNTLQRLQLLSFFKKTGESEDDETGERYRLDRVAQALQCLLWIAEHAQGSAHLMFLSSFDHLKRILTREGLDADESRAVDPLLQTDKLDAGYRIMIAGKEVTVAFLNAASAKRMGEKEYLQQYKTLFQAHRFVLITQYASASNGVNLLCLDADGHEKEFDGLHLIDAQHIWLPRPNPLDTSKDSEKQLIWYLWKLLDAKQLTTNEFRIALETNDFKKVGNRYGSSEDCLLNKVALFHQTLGRAERKWTPTPTLEVSLGNDVATPLYQYLTDAKFASLRDARKHTTSALIDAFHTQLLATAWANATAVTCQSIKDVQSQSQQMVDQFVSLLAAVRAGLLSQPQSNAVRAVWEGLQAAVLRHDRQSHYSLMDEKGQRTTIAMDAMAITLDHRIDANNLWIDGEALRIGSLAHPQSNWQRWMLDAAYAPVSQVPILRAGFAGRGYVTSAMQYALAHRTVWTPFVHHRLLKGAIGETIVQIMLEDHHVAVAPSTEIPDALYELADLKLADLPIFIDCKHYSPHTQWQFGLGPADSGYEPAFDSKTFIESLRSKFKLMRANPVFGPRAQLIVINVACTSDIVPKYWDADLRWTQGFADCAIAVIPGIFLTDRAYALSPTFSAFVQHIHSLV